MRQSITLAGIALLAAMSEPGIAVPPPIAQLSANCAEPTYASDFRVCGDPELSALDAIMARRIAAVGDQAINPTSVWIESQASWFRRRSLCAMQANQGDCLRAAYGERIAVLDGLSGKRVSMGRAFDCKANNIIGNARVDLGDDGSAAIYQSSVLLAIGQWRFEAKVWKPFVAISSKGRRVTVAAPDASGVASCVKAAA